MIGGFVLHQLPTIYGFLFCHLKIGATVVPINLLLHPEEVLYLLKDSGSTAMIYHQAVEKAVVAIRDQLQDVKTMICIGDGVMPEC